MGILRIAMLILHHDVRRNPRNGLCVLVSATDGKLMQCINRNPTNMTVSLATTMSSKIHIISRQLIWPRLQLFAYNSASERNLFALILEWERKSPTALTRGKGNRSPPAIQCYLIGSYWAVYGRSWKLLTYWFSRSWCHFNLLLP